VAVEEYKAIVRRVHEEVLNQRDLELADKYYSPEYVLHPGLPASSRGPERVKRTFSQLFEAFPDVRATIEYMVAEGDMVATRMTFSGTHAPTGKRATWPATLFSRLAEGKVVENWFLTDSGQLEAQLG
jgi:predicted ester cyclase